MAYIPPPPTWKQRLLRALIGALPGIGLGVFVHWQSGYSIERCALVAGLAALAGAGLAQPDVSALNVASGVTPRSGAKGLLDEMAASSLPPPVDRTDDFEAFLAGGPPADPQPPKR